MFEDTPSSIHQSSPTHRDQSNTETPDGVITDSDPSDREEETVQTRAKSTTPRRQAEKTKAARVRSTRDQRLDQKKRSKVNLGKNILSMHKFADDTLIGDTPSGNKTPSTKKLRGSTPTKSTSSGSKTVSSSRPHQSTSRSSSACVASKMMTSISSESERKKEKGTSATVVPTESSQELTVEEILTRLPPMGTEEDGEGRSDDNPDIWKRGVEERRFRKDLYNWLAAKDPISTPEVEIVASKRLVAILTQMDSMCDHPEKWTQSEHLIAFRRLWTEAMAVLATCPMASCIDQSSEPINIAQREYDFIFRLGREDALRKIKEANLRNKARPPNPQRYMPPPPSSSTIPTLLSTIPKKTLPGLFASSSTTKLSIPITSPPTSTAEPRIVLSSPIPETPLQPETSGAPHDEVEPKNHVFNLCLATPIPSAFPPLPSNLFSGPMTNTPGKGKKEPAISPLDMAT